MSPSPTSFQQYYSKRCLPVLSQIAHLPSTFLSDADSRNCTDKKVNQIFLIYREIQNGAVAHLPSTFLSDADSRNCTDKKVNQIFLIYREIQNGAVAKTYIWNGFLIYEEMRQHLAI